MPKSRSFSIPADKIRHLEISDTERIRALPPRGLRRMRLGCIEPSGRARFGLLAPFLRPAPGHAAGGAGPAGQTAHPGVG